MLPMILLSRAIRAVFLATLFCVAAIVAAAQTNCEGGNGALNRSRPQGLPPAEIIHKFAAREAVFAQAYLNYSYTRDITVQSLNGTVVDGEFKQIAEITHDANGRSLENVTFAPKSNLTRVTVTEQDMQNIRDLAAFPLTTDQLPNYKIEYVAMQHVDEIDTYVFDVSPARADKSRRFFRGRVWVEDHDLQIVKTCGSPLAANNQPLAFVTYREQIDGQYWFPTYARADQTLHFDVHVRAVLKMTHYKRTATPAK
jgi:hypothetical protein